MTPLDQRQLRGLIALVTDGVFHGARAIEEVHLEVARRPFAIVEAIPVVGLPATVIHGAYDISARLTYATIRGVARTVGVILDEGLTARYDQQRRSH